jgi:hypothetical protein
MNNKVDKWGRFGFCFSISRGFQRKEAKFLSPTKV